MSNIKYDEKVEFLMEQGVRVERQREGRLLHGSRGALPVWPTNYFSGMSRLSLEEVDF